MPETMSPLRAIKAKCMDCSGYVYNDVKTCNIPDCPLYPFRLGHNPNIKCEFTPAKAEALRKAHLAQKAMTHVGVCEDNASK